MSEGEREREKGQSVGESETDNGAGKDVRRQWREAGDEATERLTDCLPVDGASI